MQRMIPALLLIIGVTSGGPASVGRCEFRAGAATSNITPPLGGDVVGGFVPFPATHIHDELHARCLVLDDGQTKLAFVVCDLLGLHRSVSDAAREAIREKLSIPKENVLISGTHTHSAVSVLGSSRYAVAQELDDYQRFVVSRIVDGVARAVNLLRPAEIGFGVVEIPEHLFNRRWFMAESYVAKSPYGEIDRVKMNPPGGSPELVKPAGPTDPQLSFIVARERNEAGSGALIGLFAAYSLHYVGGVGSGHVSADYFGMFCDELVRLQGADLAATPFVPMLANGTSGDVNNINFREPRPAKKSYEQMRFVANDVAAKVHRAIPEVTYRHDIKLDAVYREPTVKWRLPSPALLAWAKEKVAEPETPSNRADLPRIYAGRAIAMNEHPAETVVPVQALRVGDVWVGTMPFEIFTEIGLEFKRRVGPGKGFMVSLAHGYFGYLPTPSQHALGGYETWLGTNRVQPETSDILLDELESMIRSRP